MRGRQLQARDKKVQQMSRDGLTEKNLTKGTEQRASSRTADISFRAAGMDAAPDVPALESTEKKARMETKPIDVQGWKRQAAERFEGVPEDTESSFDKQELQKEDENGQDTHQTASGKEKAVRNGALVGGVVLTSALAGRLLFRKKEDFSRKEKYRRRKKARNPTPQASMDVGAHNESQSQAPGSAGPGCARQVPENESSRQAQAEQFSSTKGNRKGHNARECEAVKKAVNGQGHFSIYRREKRNGGGMKKYTGTGLANVLPAIKSRKIAAWAAREIKPDKKSLPVQPYRNPRERLAGKQQKKPHVRKTMRMHAKN